MPDTPGKDEIQPLLEAATENNGMAVFFDCCCIILTGHIWPNSSNLF